MKHCISVVIPVYNTENYLDKCIQSVVLQSYKYLDIILVDDGSQDNSSNICDTWAQRDSRIRVLHQNNKGLSSARNIGVSVSKGDMISFIDSDDWIDSDYYSVLLTAIEKYGADIAASGVEKCYRNATVRYPSANDVIYTEEEALNTVILGTTFTVMACNKLYKRDLLVSNPFPEQHFHEDDFVMYRIIDSCNNLVFCKNTLYHYRQRSHGIILSGLNNRFNDKYFSYFQNLSLVAKKYPRLLLNMKVLFFQYFINDYAELLDDDSAEGKNLRNKLKEYRNMVRFSMIELWKLKRSQLKIIILSFIGVKLYGRRKASAMKIMRGRNECFR